MNIFDIIIVGGGMVGASLAVALSKTTQYQIAVVDPFPLSNNPQTFDARALALSWGSVQIFNRLGLWQDFLPYTTAIGHIHISQQGFLGVTQLHAVDEGVDALGYTITADDLGRVLNEQLQQTTQVTFLQGHFLQLESENEGGIHLSITTASGEVLSLQSRLLVGADGNHSAVRQALGIEVQVKDYHQVAILARVTMEKEHHHWAYERFTTQGPVAFLPLSGQDHKLVMVVNEEAQQEVMELSDQDFAGRILLKFGHRLGHIKKISPRVAYPLKEMKASTLGQGAILLIGNAAHAQHPIAGQGYNLGLRDVESLVNALKTTRPGDPEGFCSLCADYRNNRMQDMQRVMGFTDGLIGLFEHASPLVGHLRGIGLMAMPLLPGVKSRLARFAMGTE